MNTFSTMNKISNFISNRVMIYEPDEVFLQSYTHVVGSCDRFLLVGAYSSCHELLENLTRKKPNIVVCEINSPDMNGTQIVSEIKAQAPSADVLVLTTAQESKGIFEVIKAGANGYLIKSNNYLELVSGLDDLIQGGTPVSSKIARTIFHHFHRNFDSPLTRRETQVLTMLSEGKTYSQISLSLGICCDTSKKHIKNIYEKLNVNRKSDAIEYANVNRLI